MNRVYILMNYNYYSIKGYKEDRELSFDDPDILYDGLHHGAFLDIEDARKEAMDLAQQELCIFGKDGDKTTIEDHLNDHPDTMPVPHAAVILDEDMCDDDEIRVSVWAVREVPTVKRVPEENQDNELSDLEFRSKLEGEKGGV